MLNDLTVIVPTHSRPNLLDDALSSARKIFGNIPIIVGGNSLEFQQKNNDVSQKHGCKYLDLTEYEANIPQIYLSMLYEANSKLILPLDDDDVLDNKKLHNLAIRIAIKNNALVSFNTCQYENRQQLLYVNKYIDTNDINKLPILWNGQFQTGSAYYNKEVLINAIKRWKTPINVLDMSHDECWAMICMHLQKKYIHIPSVGLVVRKSQSQSMMKNFAIFSSRSYIDELSDMLSLDDGTRNAWKCIQIRELMQMCGCNIDANDVFSCSKFHEIEKIISQYSCNKNYRQLRQIVLGMLNGSD